MGRPGTGVPGRWSRPALSSLVTASSAVVEPSVPPPSVPPVRFVRPSNVPVGPDPGGDRGRPRSPSPCRTRHTAHGTVRERPDPGMGQAARWPARSPPGSPHAGFPAHPDRVGPPRRSGQEEGGVHRGAAVHRSAAALLAARSLPGGRGAAAGVASVQIVRCQTVVAFGHPVGLPLFQDLTDRASLGYPGLLVWAWSGRVVLPDPFAAEREEADQQANDQHGCHSKADAHDPAAHGEVCCFCPRDVRRGVPHGPRIPPFPLVNPWVHQVGTVVSPSVAAARAE